MRHFISNQSDLADLPLRLFLLPLAPMGRPNVQPLPGLRIHPTTNDAPAGENQRMGPITVDDSKLNIAVERRS